MIDVLGWVAGGAIVFVYALLAAHRMKASRLYHLINALGAIGLGANAFYHGALPSTALNATWFVLALIGIWKGKGMDDDRIQKVIVVPGESYSREAVETWRSYLKRPNPVYMKQMSTLFEVETLGHPSTLTGQPGDFVAHDPISGHFWPVAASYVEQHYREVELLEEAA